MGGKHCRLVLQLALAGCEALAADVQALWVTRGGGEALSAKV
jgi:hypothetical protein